MPKTNDEIKTKTNRVATAGIYVSGGSIEQSDWDNVEFNTLMQDYTSMRNDDCIAGTSIDILIYPILNSKYTIKPGYKEGEKPSDQATEIADYVMENFYQLQCGLNYYRRHKLLALYYGFAIFEKVWKRGVDVNGKIGNVLWDMYPIQHDTIYQWKYNEMADFTGIVQEQRRPEKGSQHITIDAEYLHIYTPFEEFKNKQGRSLLRPSRMVWKIKKQIWLASGRASCRGAGIPEFIMTPTGNETSDSTLKSTLQTMAKNVGNSENAYILSQKDVVEFKLHTLQNQEMNIPLIQQANTEMFYNTLSEFVTSGIGGNGSRAATGEHKSPYFDALESIICSYEENEDILIKEIIDNSPYAGIEKEEMPYCELERPKTTDIIAVGALINSMIGQSLTKDPAIEVYIRNMLGLPEKTEEEIIEIKEENKQEVIGGGGVSKEETLPEKPKDGLHPEEDKAELSHDHIVKLNINEPDEIFELASAMDIMQKAEIKAETIINEVYDKVIEDIAIKLERNPNAEINLAYKKEMIDRLSSVFNQAYKPGQLDIRKEYSKIAGTQLAKLTPIMVEGTDEALIAKVNTLYSAIENSIKDELLLINKKNVENAGGMKNYIYNRFRDTQKQIRNDLKTIAGSGYLAGRNDQMSELEKQDYELKRMYITALESRENLCNVCRPLGYMLMSRDQAENIGLNFDGRPVNPLCMGGNKCRCTWRLSYDI